ncbi:MAG: DUF1616 domain-containing protein [Candidatus Bathyarchaeota archaeon]|nr:DUF1616 domain-containing protein [Candidatus Bathyarchaeota archaeon]
MPLKLSDYKLVFAATCLIAVLLVASPTVGLIVKLPQGEPFSELFLLDQLQIADNYPYNIDSDVSYTFYAGVTNHLGSSSYYVLYLKLANRDDPLPNSEQGTPSSLAPLYEFRFQVQDGQTWLKPVTFSISNFYSAGNQTTIGRLTINDVQYTVNKQSTFNATQSTYQYVLFFELWLFNPESGSAQFNNRFVSLQLSCI